MKLHPNLHIVHDLGAVGGMAKPYGILPTRYEELTLGIENTSLLVHTDAGRYVFRISQHSKKANASIHAELDFMEFLRGHGITVPKIIADKAGGKLTAYHDGKDHWQVIVMAFIDGEHVLRPSDRLLADMAAIQARMHLLARGYGQDISAIRVIDTLREREYIKHIDQGSLPEDVRQLLRRGSDFLLNLSETLPRGVCHLDYHTRNILCRGGKVAAVLDFDDMAVTPYVVCLAYALWHMYDRAGPASMATYLRKYQQSRPLTFEETATLPQAMLYRNYMLTAIRILDGNTAYDDLQKYLRDEQYFLQLIKEKSRL